jgi:hypothetical protein
MILLRTLKESFILLGKSPKLFLPKILVALLYSIPMLVLPGIALESFAYPDAALIAPLLLLLALTILFSLVDISVNAAFPFFVSDYFLGRPLSFRNALSSFTRRAGVILPAAILVELAAIVIIFLFAVPLGFAVATGNYAMFVFFGALSLLFIIGFAVAFFLLYPIASLGKGGITATIENSVRKALSNLIKVTQLVVFSFLISFLTFAISFMIELSPEASGKASFLLIFAFLRLVVAMLATYQYILNPVFYIGYIEKGFR